ncbi:voltage-dependent anion-selective channel [Scaptodrosophila lebanonensis]|uniref:Voltage-dependent anion-selective channel n=1 Tax=Drosophila lebanonensis TaxID=7225 RepID=A0A6J2UAW4_DROLE|nr:voltage-dependent anion-selective channel [Scaptodrosophila lebanonensis]
MAPPVYPDLGKLARDIFKRGYHPGLWQLDCKTMTNSGIEFFTTGFASQDASKVSGSLQSKYKIEDYGLTLTERWNTDNLLFGEIMQRDKLAEGLMLALEAKFQPSSGEKDAKIKVGYAQENFNFLADMNIDPNGPLINASLVLGHHEFLGGIGLGIDTSASEVSTWKLALGWFNEQATLHGELKDGNSWLASLFYKVNEQIDSAAEIAKTAGDSGGEEPPPEGEEGGGEGELVVSLGMVYHMEGDALIRAKLNSKVEVGLGYEQKLREGITFSISTVLEGKNLTEGNHKFGLGFALEC